MPTNTACSSSLVAAHLAAASLRAGESAPAALAAGVNAMLLPRGASAAMTRVAALSPDGRCKAFGAEADGYGRGEGFTALLLEALDATAGSAAGGAPVAATADVGRARAMGPLAVLAGSAVNQDGRSSGLTAPHGPSQAALVAAALAAAGADALSFVATHGTGTPLGDPIESNALRKALQLAASARGGSSSGSSSATAPTAAVQRQLVTLGAVKSLTGHLEGTAGLAGLLQAVAALTQRAAPPLRYRNINPHVASTLEGAGGGAGGGAAIRLPIGPAPSPDLDLADESELFAGTSSFGMSGVNAHAVVRLLGGSSSAGQAVATVPGAEAEAPGLMQQPQQWRPLDFARLVPLPLGHPLVHRVLQPAWLPPPAAAATAAAGSPVVELVLPLAPCCTAAVSYLCDHVVAGQPLFPGAGYLEMAVAAAVAAAPSAFAGATAAAAGAVEGTTAAVASLVLTGVRFLAPCVLPAPDSSDGEPVRSQPRQPRELVAQLNTDTGEVRILSRGGGSSAGSGSSGSGGNSAMTVHMTAAVALLPTMGAATTGKGAASWQPIATAASAAGEGGQQTQPQPLSQPSVARRSPLSSDALRARCPEPLAARGLYSALHAAGLQYGPAFRALQSVHTTATATATSASGAGGAANGATAAAAAGRLSPRPAATAAAAGGGDAHVTGGYFLHVAALDGLLQLGAALPTTAGSSGSGGSGGGHTFVPYALDAFTVSLKQRADNAPLWGSAEAAAAPSASAGAAAAAAAPAELHRNHTLLDEDGAVVCSLHNLTTRPITLGGGASGSAGAATRGRAGAGRAGGIDGTQPAGQILTDVAWLVSDPCEDEVLHEQAQAGDAAESYVLTSSAAAPAAAAAAANALAAMQQLAGAGVSGAAQLQLPVAATHNASGLDAVAALTGLGGMLRTFNAEHPAARAISLTAHAEGGEPIFANRMAVGGAAATFRVSAHLQQAAATEAPDGYGPSAAAGAVSRAVLVPSAAAASAPPPPFQLLPLPKGSLNSLKPVPLVPVTAADGNTAGGLPACGPGTVLLRVHAVGINFRDVLNVLGMYPGDPGAPGSDCAGVVVSAGADVAAAPTAPLPGRAVFGLATGSLGSHVLASAQTLVPMPPTLSFEQAATTPTVFVTVEAALRQAAALCRGESLLLPAAAGGVGLAAAQVAAALGAEVVATAGSPAKRALLRRQGIRHVANSRDLSFAEEVVTATGGRGVCVVLNSLTSPGMVGASLSAVSRGGRWVEIGKRDIWSAARVSCERPDVRYGLLAVDFMPAAVLHAGLSAVSAGLASGSLRPLPAAVHSLSSVAAALRQMSQARHVGKVVVSAAAGPLAHGAAASAAGDLSRSALSTAGGTVMVLGGTGTLGVLVTKWLAAEAGVKRLVLLGRTGRTAAPAAAAADASALHAAATRDAAVTVFAADASTRSDLAAAVAAAASGGDGISAVIHAGGVLADATFASQTLAALRHVVSAKSSAAARLASLVASLQPAAAHVLFSSVASLLGSPGQANYAAANAGLDAAAAAMTSRGVPYASVQWGAWAGGGMAAADSQTAARVERMGMSLIQPQQGLAALEAVIGALSGGPAAVPPLLPPPAPPGVVAAVPFNWPALLGGFGRKGQSIPHLFSHMADVTGVSSSSSSSSMEGGAAAGAQALAASASPSARAGRGSGGMGSRQQIAAAVDECIRGVVGGGNGAGDLSPDAPLMGSGGLDSLGAVELRNALEARLGLQLPGTLVFDYPTPAAITEFIAAQLVKEDAAQDDAALTAAATAGGGGALLPLTLAPAASPALHRAAASSAVVGITGISSRSPGGAATSLTVVDAITPVPLSRWDIDRLWAAGSSSSSGVPPARFGAWLPAIDLFDAAAFGISAPEAALMDPQQRLLMHVAHEAVCQAVASAAGPGNGAGGGGGSGRALPAAGLEVAVAIGIASAEYTNWVCRCVLAAAGLRAGSHQDRSHLASCGHFGLRLLRNSAKVRAPATDPAPTMPTFFVQARGRGRLGVRRHRRRAVRGLGPAVVFVRLHRALGVCGHGLQQQPGGDALGAAGGAAAGSGWRCRCRRRSRCGAAAGPAGGPGFRRGCPAQPGADCDVPKSRCVSSADIAYAHMAACECNNRLMGWLYM